MDAVFDPQRLAGDAVFAEQLPVEDPGEGPGDTTAPDFPGPLVELAVTTVSATIGWPAATDAVGAVGYRISKDAGATYPTTVTALSVVLSGLTPETLYSIRVIAFDAANNESAPLSINVTTEAEPVDPPVDPETKKVVLSFVTRSGSPKANANSLRWAFFDQATPDLLGAPVAQGIGEVTGSSGEFTVDVEGTTLTAGQTGFLVISNTTGIPGASAIAFAGPVMVT